MAAAARAADRVPRQDTEHRGVLVCIGLPAGDQSSLLAALLPCLIDPCLTSLGRRTARTTSQGVSNWARTKACCAQAKISCLTLAFCKLLLSNYEKRLQISSFSSI